MNSCGDILVLDEGARRILKLSSNGEYIATLVTGGDGPADLRFPVAMTVRGEQVVVLDPTRYGTVSFGLNGAFAGHREFSTEFAARRIGHWDGRLLFSTLENYRSQADSVVERLLLRREGESPREFAAVSRPRPQIVRYPDCVSIQFDPLFSPRLTWASNGHRLVYSTGEEYSLTSSEPDGRRLFVRRDLEPREVDASIALHELGDGKEVRIPQGTCRIEPADELEGRGYNDRLPVVDELAVSPSGEICVRRRAFEGETPRIDVFAPDGTYMGTFEAKTDMFPDAFVTDSLILVKTVDELDVEHVTALRGSSDGKGRMMTTGKTEATNVRGLSLRGSLAVAIALGAIAGCDAPGTGEQPGVADGRDVSLRYVRTISWDPADSAVLRPFDLAVAGGRILIADRGSNNLRILDLEGGLVSVVGREGEGPGEFRDLRNIASSLDETQIGLSDGANRRITVYEASGERIGDFIPDGPGVGAVAFDAHGRLHVDALGSLDPNGPASSPTIGVYLPTGERVGGYGSYEPEPHPIADRLNNLVRFAMLPEGGWLVWSYRGPLERIAGAAADSGDQNIVLPRPDIEALTGPFVTEVSEGVVSITRLPVAHDIATDDRDRVYVLVVREDGEGTANDRVLVYDASGAPLRPLQLDHEAHRIAFASDSLYALERAMGGQVLPAIHVYAAATDAEDASPSGAR